MIARLVWFVLGLAITIGGMLLAVSFARAMDIGPYCLQHQEKPFCYEIYMWRPGFKARLDRNEPLSPGRARINQCISYGIGHGRGVYTTDVKDPNTKRQAENQDDWLYFCMQQARWQFVEACNNDVPENYYNDRCWSWTKPEQRKLPCTWGDCSGPSTTAFEKR